MYEICKIFKDFVDNCRLPFLPVLYAINTPTCKLVKSLEPIPNYLIGSG